MVFLFKLINKLERLAPQWFIASVAIVIAVIFIFSYKPPYDDCAPERSSLEKAQRKFLTSDPDLGVNYSYYDNFFERCLKTNSSGGCNSYFSGMQKFLNDIRLVSDRCKDQILEIGDIKKALKSFLTQVTRLAWGDGGPLGVDSRSSWLDAFHLQTFCRVRADIELYYGKTYLIRLENRILDSLPTESKIPKETKKERSLLATPCYRYL